MFVVNDDLSIYATRGDIVCLNVSATDDRTGEPYEFQPGDVLQMKVYAKKDAENVVLQKDFPVPAKTNTVGVFLTEQDTRIGDVISKPVDYWYEVTLNPYTNPQTFIGYDEDGAKVFKLFPEGNEVDEDEPTKPEDIPVVDEDLSLLSSRPVENRAIARAVTLLKNDLEATETRLTAKIKANKDTSKDLAEQMTASDAAIQQEVAVERARIDNLIASPAADDAELIDIRVGADEETYDSAGTAVRAQLNDKINKLYHKRELAVEFVEGSVYNVDSKSTLEASRGNHLIYTLQGEKRLSVSGYMWANNSYPLIAFLDAEGNVLKRFGRLNTYYTNVEMKVPDSAVQVICNGETDNKASILDMYDERNVESELDSLESGISDLNNHKMEKLYVQVAVEYELADGEVYNVLEHTTLAAPEGNYAIYNIQGEFELLVSGCSWVTNSKFPLYALYDTSGEIIEKYGDSNVVYTDVLVKIPSNAAKMIVNGIAHTPATIKKRIERNIAGEMDVCKRVGELNHWYGKKIVFLGTSVTHGALAETSYAFEAAKKLGFNLVNTGKPGMSITLNDDGTMKQYGSSTLSKEEYAAQGKPVKSESPEGYDAPNADCNDYYMTWENIFSAENADADLWVFDVVPNNSDFSLDDYNNFDKENWAYKDGSDFAEHRATFLGAVIYLMDKLYELNPYARMAFMVGSGIALSTAAKTSLKKLQDDWNIAVINLWGKINTSPKSYEKLKGKDPHPSTFAHEIMGNMLAHELLLIN